MEDLQYLFEYFEQKLQELEILVNRKNSYKYHFVSDKTLTDYKMNQLCLKVLQELAYKVSLKNYNLVVTPSEVDFINSWIEQSLNEKHNTFDTYYLYKFKTLLNKEISGDESSQRESHS